MKQKYYWKVLKKLNDKTYVSCVIDSGMYCCEFNTTRFTRSKLQENGIFVFKTRKDARRFKHTIYEGDSLYIFKVEVSGKEIITPKFYAPYWFKKYGEFHPSSSNIPKGTTTFEKVKLLKKA